MLLIDDNMFKLAKMQEALLKVSTSNREQNLKNYKKTVAEIDEKAFADILEESRHIDEHNHSLEEELEFLEKIKNAYNQLLELQLSFKRNCETYGDNDLKLSDLSRLNIEYIDNRINAIKGYLINLKNIEKNKTRLQELNDQLIEEEKKKLILDRKLLDLEDALRNNFISAEGRFVLDGNLQYTSVISEYEKTNLDFKRLLDDASLLRGLMASSEREKEEVSEKVKVAEVCYNSVLTPESRQILNEINLEYLKVQYRVTLLKIVELLSQNNDSYDLFINKRENLLELIRYRLSCMERLGVKNSIDPFSRTKVREQLDIVLSLSDNSKVINSIRKEISELNSWTEEMMSQNSSYLITLNDTRKLIEDTMSLSDVDITSVVSFDELLIKQEVLPNQVISVRNVPNKFNMKIVSQKTASVIRRVNEMMNSSNEVELNHEEDVVPELVIVPATVNNISEEIADIGVNKLIEDNDVFVEENELLEEDLVDNVQAEEPEVIFEVAQPADLNLFETVTPFTEPTLFNEKVDGLEPERTSSNFNDIETLNMGLLEGAINREPEELVIEYSNSDEVMPEAFWVTQEDDGFDIEDNVISFDDQINALLASESNDNGRARRKAA